jgi:arginine:ornithine antiporter/lysine permease
MIYAGGRKFLLLSAILYAPGTLLFFLAKRERKETVFKPVEWASICALAPEQSRSESLLSLVGHLELT